MFGVTGLCAVSVFLELVEARTATKFYVTERKSASFLSNPISFGISSVIESGYNQL